MVHPPHGACDLLLDSGTPVEFILVSRAKFEIYRGGLMVWRAVPTELLRIAACVAVDANNRFFAEMAHLDVHACN